MLPLTSERLRDPETIPYFLWDLGMTVGETDFMTPRLLDDLQEGLVLAAQGASPTVRLVGGTGLALLLGHRRSEDIDIFCAPREDISIR